MGFPGCIGFDCHGAGQRVTRDLFAGRSWKEDARLLRPMVDTFFAVLRAHEGLHSLHRVLEFDLPPQKRQRAIELVEALETKAETEQDFFRLARAAGDLLRSLATHIDRTKPLSLT